MSESIRKNRYMLFGFDACYPSGGSGDVLGTFKTIEGRNTLMKKDWRDYYEVLDLDTGEWTDIDDSEARQIRGPRWA